MFRVTTYVGSARNLMYRRSAVNIPLTHISRLPPSFKYKEPQERTTCPPPPPVPPPPPKDDRLFWGAMAALCIAAGFGFYARGNPEIRDWLSIHARWFDDLIAILAEENMSRGEYAKLCIDNIKKYFNDITNEKKPKKCSLDGTPIEEEEVIEEPEEKECDDGIVKPPCKLEPPPILTKDICEIDKCIKDFGETAIINFMTGRDACIYYNKLVQDTMTKFTFRGMKALHEAMDERKELVKCSLVKANEAIAQLEELVRYFECGVKAPQNEMDVTKGLLKDYQDKIKAMRIQFQWENDKSLAHDDQWLKVECTIDKLTTENETMFKGLKYDSKRPSMRGDGDLLLHHMVRYKHKLEAELAESIAGMTERVNRALDTLPSSDPKKVKLRNDLIQAGVKKKRLEMDKEIKKRFDDQKQEEIENTKKAFKKQLERHEETLRVKLAQKEKEAQAKMNKMVAEKVAAEKKSFAKQLAGMATKLQIVEDKLNARLKAERETRRSQELWTAGASLLAATKRGDPIVNVDKEIKAIEKATGDGDKLVLTVLKAIPKTVRERGVVPESILRERYHVMESVAMKVALVEQEGAPLPVFFLSWLQSALLFIKISGIPRCEFDNPPKEPITDLDTFDLLQRARFWIERGNIAAALRYVGSLEGASRAAASTWYEAAREHLETRQAAEAVLAHAAALGLQYI